MQESGPGFLGPALQGRGGHRSDYVVHTSYGIADSHTSLQSSNGVRSLLQVTGDLHKFLSISSLIYWGQLFCSYGRDTQDNPQGVADGEVGGEIPLSSLDLGAVGIAPANELAGLGEFLGSRHDGVYWSFLATW